MAYTIMATSPIKEEEEQVANSVLVWRASVPLPWVDSSTTMACTITTTSLTEEEQQQLPIVYLFGEVMQCIHVTKKTHWMI